MQFNKVIKIMSGYLCRYCQTKIPRKESLRLSEYPDEASWYTSHYSKCQGLIRYLKCICNDLRYRCKCDTCKQCMKTVNPDCDSKGHPKTENDLVEIFNREKICLDDSSPRTVRNRLIEELEPLDLVVKNYSSQVDSRPDIEIL